MHPFRTFRQWFRRPLNCEDVNQFIIDYLEGTISSSTRERFNAHIAQCPACGPYFDQYMKTMEMVKQDGIITPELPDALVEATLTFLREHYHDR